MGILCPRVPETLPHDTIQSGDFSEASKSLRPSQTTPHVHFHGWHCRVPGRLALGSPPQGNRLCDHTWQDSECAQPQSSKAIYHGGRLLWCHRRKVSCGHFVRQKPAQIYIMWIWNTKYLFGWLFIYQPGFAHKSFRRVKAQKLGNSISECHFMEGKGRNRPAATADTDPASHQRLPTHCIA